MCSAVLQNIGSLQKQILLSSMQGFYVIIDFEFPKCDYIAYFS